MLKFRFEGDLTHRVPEAGLEEGGPGGILGKAGEIVAWGKKPPVPSPPTSSPSGNRQGIHDISVHLRSRIVTYLVVPWLRLHAPNARGLGAIPDEGIRSRVTAKSLHTTTKRRKG